MTESNVVNLAAANPFDPAALRLDQSFAGGPAVKKLLTTVPVRKPGNQDFVRVHAGEDYRLYTAVISRRPGNLLTGTDSARGADSRVRAGYSLHCYEPACS